MKTYIKEILEKRKLLPQDTYAEYSEKICRNISSLKEYQTAANLLVFYPYLGEADILPVVKSALDEGKNVFFPKVTGKTTMDFIKIEALDDFFEGYKGIREPKGNYIFDKTRITEETLMLLPGSIFDYHMNRCGYGKGYYDRYLADCFINISKVGVCFSLQMLKKIGNVKETDISMDYVVNEKEIIRSEH